MICKKCGLDEDCRFGFCFDCADAGEARAAARSVGEHISKAIGHAFRGYWVEARIDLSWAWERLTRTGDYKPGGEFERNHGVSL